MCLCSLKDLTCDIQLLQLPGVVRLWKISGHPNATPASAQALKFLKKYHYWFTKDSNSFTGLFKKKAMDVASLEFWTENHMMVLLSTGYFVYYNSSDKKKAKVVRLFRDYMSLHARIADGAPGIFEVLSPSYTPHTIECLLNVYDFSPEGDMKNIASKVLSAVWGQIFSVTLRTGSWLSSGARVYPDTRLPMRKGGSVVYSSHALPFDKIYPAEFADRESHQTAADASPGNVPVLTALSKNYLEYALETTQWGRDGNMSGFVEPADTDRGVNFRLSDSSKDKESALNKYSTSPSAVISSVCSSHAAAYLNNPDLMCDEATFYW